MLYLRTLGGLSLEVEGKAASGAAGQRAPLAILAFIATAGETGASRDRIAALFWPESDAERAHGSLKQALYSLRRDAKSQELFLGTTSLRLNPEVIRCDASDFQSALAAKKLDSAVALYAGEFLDGVHLTGNDEFERWVDRERSVLAVQHASALETLATAAEAKKEYQESVGWWRRLAAVDSLSARVALHYMTALALAGDSEAAIRHGELYERIVYAELGGKPDPDIARLVADIRSGRISKQRPSAKEMVADEEVSSEPPSHPVKAWRGNRRRVGVFAASLVAFGGLVELGILSGHRSSDVNAARRVIALLPCEAKSNAADDSIIGDRWSEELIRKLVRVGGLRPKSWESVKRYRDTEQTLTEIRSDLNATTIIRCSVAETPQGIHLSVELVEPPDDQVVWTNDYDQLPGPLGINSAQTSAVLDIANELGSKAPRTNLATMGRPLTTDSAAFRLYRLGRHHVDQFNGPAEVPIGYFEAAIAHDSGFADAYASLAELKMFQGEGLSLPPKKYYPEAGTLLRKAISLDPGIPRAHSWLGLYLLEFTHDWAGADAEHRTAIALDPASVEAHVWYGYHLLQTDQLPAAIAEFQTAVQLDPANYLSRGHLARALVFAGQYDRAMSEIEEGRKVRPEWQPFIMHLALILIRQGQMDSARAVVSKHLVQSDPLSGWLFALAGRQDVERRILDSLRILNTKRPVDPVVLASLEIGLGHKDAALDLLERGYAERSELLLLFLGPNPAFDAIRNDVRFKSLRRRAGFPD
jgi:DNA-binding SARP family transcriptional activator/TolB-like protein/Flp pilus assembly protein TadD